MAKKIGFDAKVIVENEVLVDEPRASFLNGVAESALIEGTIIVIPAQREFKRVVSFGGAEYKSASVFVYVLDSTMSLMEGKALTVSQLTHRTYGDTDSVAAAVNNKGAVRGAIPADCSNVYGAPFKQGSVKIGDDSYRLIVPKAQAFIVGRRETHYVPQLEKVGSVWNFATKSDNPEFLDLKPRKLPHLSC